MERLCSPCNDLPGRNDDRVDKKEARAIKSLLLFYYNGLSVCAMRERVNRYTVSYWNMLTLSAMYGKLFLLRNGREKTNI